jgi:hypothetical protein
MKEKVELLIRLEKEKLLEILDLSEKMIENLSFKKRDLSLLKNNKESTFLKEEKDTLLLK